MKIEAVLQHLKECTHFKKEGEDYYLIAPFFYKNESESVPLKFYEQDGWLYISDCRKTFEFMDNRYIDIESRRERIEKIKKRFYIKETKDGELIMQFPSDSVTSIEMFIGFFVQALTLLVYSDID